jgi:hypothetical protein
MNIVCKSLIVKKNLKGLFLNPLTVVIELKFNKTQSSEQNPLKSVAVRNMMNKYPLKSNPNLEFNSI